MGQIIRFPELAPAGPAPTGSLGDAESLLLLAIRLWVAAVRHDEDPEPRLQAALEDKGLQAAVSPLHRLMTEIARTARRRIDVHCPRCATVSADERRLLEATQLAQTGEREQAAQALARVLMSTQGAEFVIEPLAGISALFAATGHPFRRRRAPAALH